MATTDVTLLSIHAAYLGWLGKPDAVLRLQHATDSDDAPPEIDVLFFEQTADRDNEAFVFVGTAGMSTRVMPGTRPRTELLLNIEGTQDWGALRDLGTWLADLALWPFLEPETRFEPDRVLGDVTLPIFDGMTCLLLTEWGVRPPPYRLPGMAPTVEILEVKPLHAGEAEVALIVGAIEASRRFRERGINWADPTRPPALLYEFPLATTWERLTAQRGWRTAWDTTAVPALVPLVRVLWADIISWCALHAPRVARSLRGGASVLDLQRLEARLSCILPDGYASSLLTHNGDADLSTWHYLGITGVWRIASTLRSRSEAGSFMGRTVIGAGRAVIRSLWWHRGWVPFAQDQTGRLLCLDLDPAVGGIVGQIIAWDPNTGPVATGHHSFEAWLREYRNDLLAGRYHVDADSYIAAP